MNDEDTQDEKRWGADFKFLLFQYIISCGNVSDGIQNRKKIEMFSRVYAKCCYGHGSNVILFQVYYSWIFFAENLILHENYRMDIYFPYLIIWQTLTDQYFKLLISHKRIHKFW